MIASVAQRGSRARNQTIDELIENGTAVIGSPHTVREKIEMRRRFEAAAATICSVNLKRFLKEKLRDKQDRQV